MMASAITERATGSQAARTEDFIQLLIRNRQRVFSFIMTLVPDWNDAEEILQETSTVLWRKFDQFEPGSDFVRWANQVAYYEVLKFRKRKKTESVRFRRAVLEKLARESTEMNGVLEDQREALARCVQKLPEKDRQLLRLRYGLDASPRGVAEQLGRSVDAVYKSLRRVRHALLGCVRRALALENET